MKFLQFKVISTGSKDTFTFKWFVKEDYHKKMIVKKYQSIYKWISPSNDFISSRYPMYKMYNRVVKYEFRKKNKYILNYYFSEKNKSNRNKRWISF